MNYYSLNKYLKNTFGEKVYKISLNGNMTCPNRDGTLGTRGCIFCSRGGSGEFASDALLPVHGQIDIVALSIATRPDCLGNNVLGLLEKLNKIKPVWVELGLQTIHEKSADYIRRMYPLSVYDSATENLHKIGINVITHIILGLPNESKKMMLESVKYAGSKTDGIKLQLLHVLKNTDLCDDYESGKFDLLSMEDYIDILCDCVEVLPENVVIHRLTGDGDKKLLVASMWSADKKRVLNSINREFAKRDITQGRKAK